MITLIELLRFTLTDSKGHSAPVKDLAIALLEDDYPPVTAVLFEDDGKLKKLDWDAVVEFNTRSKKIVADDLSAAAVVPGDDHDVLLRRDILDSLILDLLGRRTTRVCDVIMDDDDGVLRLKAADAGMAAMLRRVFRGHWTGPNPNDAFDWKYVEFLRGDPEAVRNGAGYRLRINRLPAGEIARLTDYVPYLHAAELLKLLPNEKAADVLEATNIERQVQVIEELSDKEAVDLLCLMSPDMAADLIAHSDVKLMRRYLNMMPEKCRRLVVELLKFPEDSVGGAMINDIVLLASDLTCEDAKQTLQEHLDDVRFTSVIFVVDDAESKRLKGTINLKDLLSADDSKTLENVMDPYVQTLGPFDNANDAAYRMVSGQLPAMAVIDKNGSVIGAMTVEAAIARLLPATSGIQRLKVFS